MQIWENIVKAWSNAVTGTQKEKSRLQNVSGSNVIEDGAIGGSRTHYLSLRRRSLYPSELQPQLHEMYYSKSCAALQSPTENQPHFALYCIASCLEMIWLLYRSVSWYFPLTKLT